jgi:hypothetical protein
LTLAHGHQARLNNEETIQAHARGLEQLVVRRGGIRALPPAIQLPLSWCLVTIPGRFPVLLSKSADGEIETAEMKLMTFLQSIQELSVRPDSPYALHAPFFAPSTPLHRLLSSVPDPPAHLVIRLAAQFRMKATCRLAALLNIHSIYLDHSRSFRDLSRQLLSLSARMLEHEMHRRGTVEYLAALMMVAQGDGNDMVMSDHSWEMVRMTSVTQSLTLDVLRELEDLLFACLTPGDENWSPERDEFEHSGESKAVKRTNFGSVMEKVRGQIGSGAKLQHF